MSYEDEQTKMNSSLLLDDLNEDKDDEDENSHKKEENIIERQTMTSESIHFDVHEKRIVHGENLLKHSINESLNNEKIEIRIKNETRFDENSHKKGDIIEPQTMTNESIHFDVHEKRIVHGENLLKHSSINESLSNEKIEIRMENETRFDENSHKKEDIIERQTMTNESIHFDVHEKRIVHGENLLKHSSINESLNNEKIEIRIENETSFVRNASNKLRKEMDDDDDDNGLMLKLSENRVDNENISIKDDANGKGKNDASVEVVDKSEREMSVNDKSLDGMMADEDVFDQGETEMKKVSEKLAASLSTNLNELLKPSEEQQETTTIQSDREEMRNQSAFSENQNVPYSIERKEEETNDPQLNSTHSSAQSTSTDASSTLQETEHRKSNLSTNGDKFLVDSVHTSSVKDTIPSANESNSNSKSPSLSTYVQSSKSCAYNRLDDLQQEKEVVVVAQNRLSPNLEESPNEELSFSTSNTSGKDRLQGVVLSNSLYSENDNSSPSSGRVLTVKYDNLSEKLDDSQSSISSSSTSRLSDSVDDHSQRRFVEEATTRTTTPPCVNSSLMSLKDENVEKDQLATAPILSRGSFNSVSNSCTLSTNVYVSSQIVQDVLPEPTTSFRSSSEVSFVENSVDISSHQSGEISPRKSSVVFESLPNFSSSVNDADSNISFLNHRPNSKTNCTSSIPNQIDSEIGVGGCETNSFLPQKEHETRICKVGDSERFDFDKETIRLNQPKQESRFVSEMSNDLNVDESKNNSIDETISSLSSSSSSSSSSSDSSSDFDEKLQIDQSKFDENVDDDGKSEMHREYRLSDDVLQSYENSVDHDSLKNDYENDVRIDDQTIDEKDVNNHQTLQPNDKMSLSQSKSDENVLENVELDGKNIEKEVNIDKIDRTTGDDRLRLGQSIDSEHVIEKMVEKVKDVNTNSNESINDEADDAKSSTLLHSNISCKRDTRIIRKLSDERNVNQTHECYEIEINNRISDANYSEFIETNIEDNVSCDNNVNISLSVNKMNKLLGDKYNDVHRKNNSKLKRMDRQKKKHVKNNEKNGDNSLLSNDDRRRLSNVDQVNEQFANVIDESIQNQYNKVVKDKTMDVQNEFKDLVPVSRCTKEKGSDEIERISDNVQSKSIENSVTSNSLTRTNDESSLSTTNNSPLKITHSDSTASSLLTDFDNEEDVDISPSTIDVYNSSSSNRINCDDSSLLRNASTTILGSKVRKGSSSVMIDDILNESNQTLSKYKEQNLDLGTELKHNEDSSSDDFVRVSQKNKETNNKTGTDLNKNRDDSLSNENSVCFVNEEEKKRIERNSEIGTECVEGHQDHEVDDSLNESPIKETTTGKPADIVNITDAQESNDFELKTIKLELESRFDFDENKKSAAKNRSVVKNDLSTETYSLTSERSILTVMQSIGQLINANVMSSNKTNACSNNFEDDTMIAIDQLVCQTLKQIKALVDDVDTTIDEPEESQLKQREVVKKIVQLVATNGNVTHELWTKKMADERKMTPNRTWLWRTPDELENFAVYVNKVETLSPSTFDRLKIVRKIQRLIEQNESVLKLPAVDGSSAEMMKSPMDRVNIEETDKELMRSGSEVRSEERDSKSANEPMVADSSQIDSSKRFDDSSCTLGTKNINTSTTSSSISENQLSVNVNLEMDVFEATENEVSLDTRTEEEEQHVNSDCNNAKKMVDNGDRNALRAHEADQINPLKRKLSVNKLRKQPPKKKLVMSTSLLYRCRFCLKSDFKNKQDLSNHGLVCKIKNRAIKAAGSSSNNRRSSSVISRKLPTTSSKPDKLNDKTLDNTRSITSSSGPPVGGSALSILPKSTSEESGTKTALISNKSGSVVDKSSDKTLDASNGSPPNSLTAASKLSAARKVFLCAACHEYYEFWTMYLHMLNFHKRYICLYCLGMFSSSLNLCDHLCRNHYIKVKSIQPIVAYKEYAKYLMTCVACGTLVPGDFTKHRCLPKVKPKQGGNEDESGGGGTTTSNSDVGSGTVTEGGYPDPEDFMLATMTEGGSGNATAGVMKALADKDKTDDIVQNESSNEELQKSIGPNVKDTPILSLCTKEKHPILTSIDDDKVGATDSLPVVSAIEMDAQQKSQRYLDLELSAEKVDVSEVSSTEKNSEDNAMIGPSSVSDDYVKEKSKEVSTVSTGIKQASDYALFNTDCEGKKELSDTSTTDVTNKEDVQMRGGENLVEEVKSSSSTSPKILKERLKGDRLSSALSYLESCHKLAMQMEDQNLSDSDVDECSADSTSLLEGSKSVEDRLKSDNCTEIGNDKLTEEKNVDGNEVVKPNELDNCFVRLSPARSANSLDLTSKHSDSDDSMDGFNDKLDLTLEKGKDKSSFDSEIVRSLEETLPKTIEQNDVSNEEQRIDDRNLETSLDQIGSTILTSALMAAGRGGGVLTDLKDSEKGAGLIQEMISEGKDDEENKDGIDSDNEDSLKIDDSVYEEEENEVSRKAKDDGKYLVEEKDDSATVLRALEAAPVGAMATPVSVTPIHPSPPVPVTSSPSLKINPLRIKIKCSNSGDTYERVKSDTEIREKEMRERKYDDAIDEVIRKSILEYELKESERLREEKERMEREKEEYERLQREYQKRQEEYLRIQEHYQRMQESEMRSNENDEGGEEEEEEEEADVKESEENGTLRESVNNRYTNDIEMERSVEERSEQIDEKPVKLLQVNNEASLIKEELLKQCEKLFAGGEDHSIDEEEPSPELMEEEKEEELADVIPLASEDKQPMALSLDEKLDSLEPKFVVKECVRTSCSICIYCHHATRIVVKGKQLALHILAEHRYMPVKNDTTDDLIAYVKTNLDKLENEFFSSDTFDSGDAECFKPFDDVYRCFQCEFTCKHQRELTSHKRKMHSKTTQICLLCKQIFLNYSELLFHYCAGVYNPKPDENTFWCGICGVDKLPSAFRLMVHLRKKHTTCNICLERCVNESKLLQHTLKHKVIHLCYKCNISYRNKQDIMKHLFWKHGTESIVCKKCLQKKWSHVYHFCQPPARFTCDECNHTFAKSVALKVHKRLHQGIFPYECVEVEGCGEKFVSKKLLEKHVQMHREPPKPPTPPPSSVDEVNDESKNSEPHIDVCNVDESGGPPSSVSLSDTKSSSKTKKKKKSKFDLENMNLPPLNLSSDSDSSEDEKETPPTVLSDQTTTSATMTGTSEQDNAESGVESVSASGGDGVSDNKLNQDSPTDASNRLDTSTSLTTTPDGGESLNDLPENCEPMIVPDVWDHFTSFTQAQNVFRHVDNEHDYHVVYERPPPTPPPPPLEEEKLDNDANRVPALMTSSSLDELDVSRMNAITEEDKIDANVSSLVDKSVDTSLNKTTSDDSSSDSSSSSSCGSQCGSNCSCSSSSSSSSSSSDESSSESDSSDAENRKKQEERRQMKKLKKKKKGSHDHSGEVNVTIENNVVQQEEQEDEVGAVQRASPSETVEEIASQEVTPTPLPINESDLDTDVSLSDEDFYDEKPQLIVNKIEDKTSVASLPLTTVSSSSSSSATTYGGPSSKTTIPSVAPITISTSQLTPSVVHHHSQAAHHPHHKSSTPRTSSSSSKPPRKRPKMRNLPTKVSFKHPFMLPSPSFEKKKTTLSLISSSASAVAPAPLTGTFGNATSGNGSPMSAGASSSFEYSLTPSRSGSSAGPGGPIGSIGETSVTATGGDENTRSSKRKRKQNRFYGYSDDDEDMNDYDNDESEEYSIKPQPHSSSLKRKLSWKPSFNDKIPVQSASPVRSYNQYHQVTPVAASTAPDLYRSYSQPSSRQPQYHHSPAAASSSSETHHHPSGNSYPSPYNPYQSSANSSSSSEETEDENPYAQQVQQPPLISSFSRSSFAALQDRGAVRNDDLLMDHRKGATETSVPLYCYCQCPYDEVSEMIACDGDDCKIEWFHFECVGIMIAPKGKWYCPQCKPKYQPY